MVDGDGVRHTVLGFETEADAEAGIVADAEGERLGREAISTREA